MHSKLIAAVATLSLAAACLERPVAPIEPNTSNQFVDQIVQNRIERIDLLFMIDNSRSMADKQEILKQAVPVLLNRLVSPICVDEQGVPVGGNAPCAQGAPEFTPIKDIHIGVVTSDLGDMSRSTDDMSGNTNGCEAPDRGLIAGSEEQPDLVNWNSQGFLAWDPDATTRPRNDPPGMTQAPDLISAFQNMVVAAGENGCGLEASLESWYRFLIDPEPPERVDFDRATSQTTASGIDNTLLAQRAAFLRPDSLLAVVMLTDENDCSLADYGLGGYVGATERMPKANSVCDRDLNDPCCAPCNVTIPNCAPPESDPKCQPDPYHSDVTDPSNLRCMQQKRRFGWDFLQPISRYVDGLTSPQIYNRRGELVPNPLFTAPAGAAPRDRSLVYLAGITGVPWQDVSDEASWTDPRRLRYLSYAELEAKGRFDWMLGKPGERPQDPFMIEAAEDRTTIPGLSLVHPAGASIGSLSPSTAVRRENPINGHETAGNTEPQFACIFPKTPTTCTGGTAACDCNSDASSLNRSLCEGNVQTHAKAYPGTRQLEVLRGVGMRTNNAIVASICPKVTDAAEPAADPNYGYNPAVTAVIERLKEQIAVKCLPRQLEVDGEGQVPCRVIEAQRPDATNATCPCNTSGRKALGDSPVGATVREHLQGAGYCGVPGAPACNDYCLCEVEQFSDANLDRCQRSAEPLSDAQGFCYVDGLPHGTEQATDAAVMARAASVAMCPATQRRVLRFSSEVPSTGSVAFIACTGQTLH